MSWQDMLFQTPTSGAEPLQMIREPFLPDVVLWWSRRNKYQTVLPLCFRGRVGQRSVAAGEGQCPTRSTNKILGLVKTGRP